MSAFVKSHGLQVRLAQLFILILLAAIFIGWYWGAVPPTTTFFFCFVLVQLAVSHSCIEALTKNVPRHIDRIQRDNCLREDGTWSKRRARIEEKSRDRVRIDLAKAFLLIAIATNVGGWFVHSEVIPFPAAVEAMGAFHWDSAEWKRELRDDERRLDGWLTRSSHLSPSQAHAHKRRLWKLWPAAVSGAIIWVVCCCSYLAMVYRHSLKELRASANYRAEQYKLESLHRSVGHDDFAKAKRQRKSSRSKDVTISDVKAWL